MGRVLLGATVALLLAACGGGEPSSPVIGGDGSTTDPAGSWVLVDADPTIDVPDDARVTLTVSADDGGWQVGGTSACNAYGSTVTTDGRTWLADSVGGTAMACEEPRMAAERAYLDALQAIDTWTRPSEDELVLTGAAVELRFAALAPVPLAELTGTTWVLEALVAGTGADAPTTSTAADAEVATLQLEPDGTMAATTGCRSFAGEWIETGDEILLTTFGQRDDSPNVAADGTTTCTPAVVAQEDHVLSVLGDGFRAELDGQHLTLLSRDGLGLRYRAAAD
jgi:heat shock protein HslJ